MNYPLKQTADKLASYGRQGDSMLVHMDPAEVAGIAALTPGGLTTNPVTGQLEAFKLKEFLRTIAPIMGSVVGTAIMPGLAPAFAGAIGSGLATTAVTGDLERGLISGIVGAGLGSALGAAGRTAAETASIAVGDAATSTLVPVAEQAIGTPFGSFATGIGPDLGQAGSEVARASIEQAAAQSTPFGSFTTGIGPNLGRSSVLKELQQAPVIDLGQSVTPEAGLSFTQRLAAPFQRGSGLTTELMELRTALPAFIGMGQLAGMDTRDAWNKGAKELAGNREEKLQQAYDDLQGAYRLAQPNAITGLNPYRARISRNMPPPGYAHGGQLKRYDIRNRDGNRYGYEQPADMGYDGIDPITIQQGLRGIYNVSGATPAGFMPGFDPEFNYFQNDPVNIQSPPVGSFPSLYSADINRAVLPEHKKEKSSHNFADGGEVTLDIEAGAVGIPAGGIADIENQYTQTAMPTGEEVQVLAQVILSGSPQSDQLIEAFIARYGVEVFRQIRQLILQSVSPNAQTEGLIAGQGGGMDDQVPGMIGAEQPVAVSPGEYIIPADVVSGLGDGSSEAGASELDLMAENVRRARGGQPLPVNPREILPA